MVFVASGLFLPYALGALRFPLMLAALLIGIAGPDFYLVCRLLLEKKNYRQAFPDLLDLLVVCVDAGLSLEAAFDRVTSEVTKRSHALGMHLAIMSAEMHAGRSMVEALESLADRLRLQEAGSLVAMLRQSIELGSDVGEALRVFSDEMRDKRLLRAEEKANKLPVKMVFPMACLIFPVIMAEIMLPLALRVVAVLS